MTALDYLADPDFRAFCDHWVTDGRCPFPFSDWLRERGLELQADAADWATNEPDRGKFQGSTGGPGGIRPLLTSFSELVSFLEVWPSGYWGLRDSATKYRSALPGQVHSQIVFLSASGVYKGATIDRGTAIAIFLDGWAAAVEGGWRANESSSERTDGLTPTQQAGR